MQLNYHPTIRALINTMHHSLGTWLVFCITYQTAAVRHCAALDTICTSEWTPRALLLGSTRRQYKAVQDGRAFTSDSTRQYKASRQYKAAGPLRLKPLTLSGYGVRKASDLPSPKGVFSLPTLINDRMIELIVNL